MAASKKRGRGLARSSASGPTKRPTSSTSSSSPLRQQRASSLRSSSTSSRKLYHRDALSLTGALTRSLRAAHEHLREWNSEEPERAPGRRRRQLPRAARRGRLSRAGRAQPRVRAFGLRRFRRIHATSTTFDHALGIANEFDPHLTRIAARARRPRAARIIHLDEIVPERPHRAHPARAAPTTRCPSCISSAATARTWRSCCSSRSKRSSDRRPTS